MGFREINTAGANLGNQLRRSANTKGTDKKGVPTALAVRGRDFSFAPAANPDASANRTSGRKDSNPRGSEKPDVPSGRRSLSAVANPDGAPNRTRSNKSGK
jgi:hypothetical protein